ncbi:MAG: fructosamine kinase family protein [Gammaproteobacteria bacterium]|nr:fructosamine kinase family protein [Gammaproteobacteria bacterium]
MTDWKPITDHLSQLSERPFKPGPPQRIGGGCINTTFILDDKEQRYFVKLNDSHLLSMFEAEAQGLEELQLSATIRVPRPICFGKTDQQAYLVLEFIDMTGRADPVSAGRQLAALHRTTSERFGWHRDNTIGSTPQPNEWYDNWMEFWREKRLGYQLTLAAENGYSGNLQRRGEILLQSLPSLLEHQPVPSLTHGDLWSGNLAYDRDSQPVIYDPATCYADRETDLAMTELFGGFGSDFYAAYREAWPLIPGYSTRRTLYNLYHILNHLNLFGGGYGNQALGMIDRLLAELGY